MSQYAGSVRSVYSSASTVRSTRTLGTSRGHQSLKHNKIQWYQKPFVKNAFYTDLTTGAWHLTFYTLFLSVWSLFQGCFEIYILEEAKPDQAQLTMDTTSSLLNLFTLETIMCGTFSS